MAVIKGLNKDPTSNLQIVFAGGNLENGRMLGQMVKERVLVKLPAATVVCPETAPVTGAAFLAIRDYEARKNKV